MRIARMPLGSPVKPEVERLLAAKKPSMKPSTFTLEVGEVGVDDSLEEQLHEPENLERLRDKFPRQLLTCRASKARLST
jgi:hypothetical protein